MGFAGINISGHTGTQFRHRKAFRRRRELQQRKSRTNVTRPSDDLPKSKFQITDFKDTQRDQRIGLGIRLFVVSCVLVLLCILIYAFSSNNYNNVVAYQLKIQEDKDKLELMEKKNAYKLLLSSGKSHLKRGELDEAQYEFVLAISNDQYGKEAIIGLSEVLKIKCEKMGLLCEDAKLYQNYLMETERLSLDNSN